MLEPHDPHAAGAGQAGSAAGDAVSAPDSAGPLDRTSTLDFLAALWTRALALIDDGRWNVWIVIALGALVWLPALGSIGLWDPWETHYAEVSREMLERGDFVHPYWESAYFFSKPIFTFWMMAGPLWLVGAGHGSGALPRGLEWAVRTPFALCAITGLVGVYLLASRLISKRAGLAASLVLATCPQYTLLAKQAMVDMPLVAFLTLGIACMAAWLWAPEGQRPRSALWAYALWALAGIATLTKETLGIAIPGMAFAGTLLLGTDWRAFFDATPNFPGTDLPSRAARWICERLKGLVSGVALDVAIGAVRALHTLIAGARRIRLVTGTLLFTAIAAPWYSVMYFFHGVDDESKTFPERIYHDNFARLAKGVHTTTPGGNFTYFVEQLGFGMFPWSALVPVALAAAALRIDAYFRARRAGIAVPDTQRAEAFGLLIALVWALSIYTLMTCSATKFHHYAFPSLPAYAICIGAWAVRATSHDDGSPRLAGPAALLGAVILFSILGRDLSMTPKVLIDLFVYNYERPYPVELDPRLTFEIAFGAAGGILGLLVVTGWTRAFAPVMAAFALLFGLYLSHVHYNRIGPHWSQRTLTDVYWRERRGDEPLLAYQMNWRGETLYSRNTVVQVKDAARLKELIEKDGREFVIVEQSRYQGMLTTLGKPYRDNARILDQSQNKFYLVAID